MVHIQAALLLFITFATTCLHAYPASSAGTEPSYYDNYQENSYYRANHAEQSQEISNAPQYDFSNNAFMTAMRNGSAGVVFRLRHENAHQEDLKHAKATTLRSQVAYHSAEFNQAKLGLEVTDVSNFLGQDYNANVDGLRKEEYAVIADPKGTGVTQGYISYQGLEATDLTFGRQYIHLDNERFIGKVDFRQYPQSFDALSVRNTMFENLDLFYAFVTNVNTTNANGRTNDGRRNLRTHLVNVGWHGFQYGKITGYVYLNKDRTVINNSHVILGLRVNADNAFQETFGFGYEVEGAQQQAKFNNPQRYHANYFAISANKSVQVMSGTIGYERLEGNSNIANRAFQTPLATNHKFHGWAEAFTTKPDRGLQDLYGTIAAHSGQVTVSFTYHHFRFESGSPKKAGNEVDLGADMRLNDSIGFNISYANFNPKNSSATNTRRIWLTMNAKFL